MKKAGLLSGGVRESGRSFMNRKNRVLILGSHGGSLLMFIPRSLHHMDVYCLHLCGRSRIVSVNVGINFCFKKFTGEEWRSIPGSDQ
jgi:hypothetical protein